MMKVLFLFYLSFSLGYAQTQDDFANEAESMMQQMHEFSKRMRERFFQDDFFQDAPWGFADSSSFSSGIEHKVTPKDDSVEVEIYFPAKNQEPQIEVSEKGIQVKANFTEEKETITEHGKSYSKVSRIINELIPLPLQADPKKVDIKKEEDKLIVVFGKREGETKQTSSLLKKNISQPIQEKKPIKLDKADDRTI